MEYQLLQVYEDLVPLLSAMSQSIFIDYYTPINGKESAEYMANLFLSEDSINKEIENETIFKMMMHNLSPIGFSEYKIDKDRLFLSKLYLHEKYRNQKLGRVLLEDAIAYVKENKLHKIYLTCNKHNPTYQKYLHWGFITIDSIVSDIGNGFVMDDYIMEYTINE